MIYTLFFSKNTLTYMYRFDNIFEGIYHGSVYHRTGWSISFYANNARIIVKSNLFA